LILEIQARSTHRLDSGFGPDRASGRRLDLDERMRISAHHLSRPD
jgi:hypothetical protein